MRQLFLVLLLVMFASTSVFAEGLGVHAALQQANSRTRTRTIPSQVNISFLSSHDVEDDSTPDWLAPLLFGVGGTGLAVLGTFLVFAPGSSTVTSELSPIFLAPGVIIGLSGFIVFFESLFS